MGIQKRYFGRAGDGPATKLAGGSREFFGQEYRPAFSDTRLPYGAISCRLLCHHVARQMAFPPILLRENSTGCCSFLDEVRARTEVGGSGGGRSSHQVSNNLRKF